MNITTFVFLLFVQLWQRKNSFLTYLFLSIFFYLRSLVQIVSYIVELALEVIS